MQKVGSALMTLRASPMEIKSYPLLLSSVIEHSYDCSKRLYDVTLSHYPANEHAHSLRQTVFPRLLSCSDSPQSDAS